MKTRLDVWLVQQLKTESRNKAKQLIEKGLVHVDGAPVTKPNIKINEDTVVELQDTLAFVSRGGEKLDGAIKTLGISVDQKTVLDVGSSTGGFTDCLLTHGATHVYCIDVGKDQLHESLRAHAQVTFKESFHIKELSLETFGQSFPFAVVDVSFISLTKVIPHLLPCLSKQGQALLLFKPQFEMDRSLSRQGVIKNDDLRRKHLEKFCKLLRREHNLQILGVCDAVIKGPKGNQESFVWISI